MTLQFVFCLRGSYPFVKGFLKVCIRDSYACLKVVLRDSYPLLRLFVKRIPIFCLRLVKGNPIILDVFKGLPSFWMLVQEIPILSSNVLRDSHPFQLLFCRGPILFWRLVRGIAILFTCFFCDSHPLCSLGSLCCRSTGVKPAGLSLCPRLSRGPEGPTLPSLKVQTPCQWI